ncbi:hypothetical protein [Rhizobium sp. L1K21]|uniref:hypothetical protein n=1 Tax=Rhizobium sp. L1K21 TaxID=2954933 RepID=UPI002092A01D|nr:hypothetical protein [Rhizobium sp. L1K21]
MALRKFALVLSATVAATAFAGTLSAEPAGSYHFGGWHLRGGNYYSANQLVRYFHHNGTYVFSSGFSLPDPFVITAPAPRAKIIDVKTQADPCSYEHGVCVIRGIDY